MARDIGGIEVVLDLNSDQFTRQIERANDELKTFEKEAKASTNTLEDMEKAQERFPE